jgi:hypothetical protein
MDTEYFTLAVLILLGVLLWLLSRPSASKPTGAVQSRTPRGSRFAAKVNCPHCGAVVGAAYLQRHIDGKGHPKWVCPQRPRPPEDLPSPQIIARTQLEEEQNRAESVRKEQLLQSCKRTLQHLEQGARHESFISVNPLPWWQRPELRQTRKRRRE